MTIDEFLTDWYSANPFLHVHTSGSTGTPKDILVEKRRMEASASMTCNFLGLKRGDTALLCMPLDYIAGKMMVVRSIVCGLKLLCVEPSSTPLDNISSAKLYDFSKTLQTNTIDGLNIAGTIGVEDTISIDFAAMVPLQVIKSINSPKLRQVKHIIIGGGPIDSKLEATLRDFPNGVWSTYGMTETLSHVALRRISGNDSSCWYSPFDDVRISLAENDCLVIDAPRVCQGTLVTNDIAEINSSGAFRILGRRDNVIISGGIKIQIEEVERKLRETVEEMPFQITSRQDSTFGEIIVMLIPDSLSDCEYMNLKGSIALLPKYWQPKDTVRVKELPMTGTGKPNRALAKKLACGN